MLNAPFLEQVQGGCLTRSIALNLAAGTIFSDSQDTTHLQAVQQLVTLAWATACVEAWAEGHVFDVCELQALLVLAVSVQQQQHEQHLELTTAVITLTGPLLSCVWCSGLAVLVAPPV